MVKERVLLADGVSLELVFRSSSDYRLTCRKGTQVMVEYWPARNQSFISVEKLRYDFENDVQNALRKGR
jgi:hypothetical protein